jgi:hypothetical protein
MKMMLLLLMLMAAASSADPPEVQMAALCAMSTAKLGNCRICPDQAMLVLQSRQMTAWLRQ